MMAISTVDSEGWGTVVVLYVNIRQQPTCCKYILTTGSQPLYLYFFWLQIQERGDYA